MIYGYIALTRVGLIAAAVLRVPGKSEAQFDFLNKAKSAFGLNEDKNLGSGGLVLVISALVYVMP